MLHMNESWKHSAKWRKKKKVKSLSHVPLYDPVDCNLQGSSIHGIFQARILEWVAISFSRGSFQPRDWTRVSCIAGRRFTIWATKVAEWRKTRWRKPNEENHTQKAMYYMISFQLSICPLWTNLLIQKAFQ